MVAAILFLLALNFGGEIFPWKSAAVIVPLVFTFVLVALFVVVESRFAREPILPPRLFKNRSVSSTLITNFFFGVNFFALVYYLPVYFQVVKGDSAMWSGKIRSAVNRLGIAQYGADLLFGFRYSSHSYANGHLFWIYRRWLFDYKDWILSPLVSLFDSLGMWNPYQIYSHFFHF